MTDDYDEMKQRWHGVPPEEPEIRPEDELTDAVGTNSPRNLCRHDYQPHVNLVTQRRWTECVHCGQRP